MGKKRHIFLKEEFQIMYVILPLPGGGAWFPLFSLSHWLPKTREREKQELDNGETWQLYLNQMIEVHIIVLPCGSQVRPNTMR